MKILHLISSVATRRDREQQQIDAMHLRGAELALADMIDEKAGRAAASGSRAGLVHVYGPPPFGLLRELGRPWIGSANPPAARLPWRRAPEPAVEPHALLEVSESVDPEWLTAHPDPVRPGPVASLAGESRSAVRREALARLARVRSDVEWIELRKAPSPAEMSRYAAWVDPGTEDDGCALEALAWGAAVIAARTPRNVARSSNGAAAVLVPPRDANEMVHAILAVLYKPETIESTLAAAKQGRSRFDPNSRAEALLRLYRRIVS